jgi:lysophospholipase I
MRSDANLKTPLFQVHGEDDTVVNIKFGELSHQELKKLDMNVEFHKYPDMGHEANPQELKDLGAWIKARIGVGEGSKSQT